MATTLDHRPSRKDLTDRECADILGGTLLGMLCVWSLGEVREAVESLAAYFAGKPPIYALAAPANLFTMTAAELRHRARSGAVQVAVRWWAERDDKQWEALRDQAKVLSESAQRDSDAALAAAAKKGN